MQSANLSGSALFVAHPGHELRLHGWISREKPMCMILTTGSRSGSETTRLQASAVGMMAAGAHISQPFGVVLDRDLYHAVLMGNIEPFRDWKNALVNALLQRRPQRLVIDSWQLYSVSHDLAHLIGRLAVNEASKVLEESIEVLQYDVVPAELGGIVPTSLCVSRITLTEEELEEKLAALADYPDIEFELIELRQIEGDSCVRLEALFQPAPIDELLAAPLTPPKYEAYGEARKASGVYGEVIRWHHVERIARELLTVEGWSSEL